MRENVLGRDQMGREAEAGEALYSTPEHDFFSFEGKIRFRTQFGNTGLYWIITPGPGGISKKHPAWQMHFAPENEISRPSLTHTSSLRTYGKYKNRPEDDVEYLNDIKYARMFAEGVKAMVGFYLKIGQIQNPDYKKFYLHNPPKSLHFGTNRRMEDFALKLIGEKYYKYDMINLAKLAADFEQNPDVLKKVLQFADPEKLKEIKIKSPDLY